MCLAKAYIISRVNVASDLDLCVCPANFGNCMSTYFSGISCVYAIASFFPLYTRFEFFAPKEN